MGEYADDYFRREVEAKFGFDPGPNDKPTHKAKPGKVHCPTCQKRVKAVGLKDHMRDAHQTKENHENEN
jgi:hypothetical protein